MVVYGKELVIPAKVEISSLIIIQEYKLSNAEWVSKRIDQLSLIDEKRVVAIFMVNYIERESFVLSTRELGTELFNLFSWSLSAFFLFKMNTKGNLH